jgi:hypothetical protein
MPILQPPDLTGHDLIDDALVELGALAAGDEATPEDQALGLRRLNAMIDGWRIERYTFGMAAAIVFPLTPGVAVYTLGPGGTWAGLRPDTGLEAASLRYGYGGPAAQQVDAPLRIYTDAELQAVAQPGQATGWPIGVHSNRAFPVATLTFVGVPTTAGLAAVLWYVQVPAYFVDLTTVYRVPPGVSEMLLYNLAERLSEPETRPLTPHVARMAAGTLARFKRQNAPRVTLAVDPALRPGGGGPVDIRTGP